MWRTRPRDDRADVAPVADVAVRAAPARSRERSVGAADGLRRGLAVEPRPADVAIAIERGFLATVPTPTHRDVPDLSTTDASDVEIDLYCNGTQGRL
jgi:hypothetical protein